MTDLKQCSVRDGKILAADHEKRIRIGNRSGIIHHNSWVDFSEGENHQVGLDFASDLSTSKGEASEESRAILLRLFPEYAIDETKSGC